MAVHDRHVPSGGPDRGGERRAAELVHRRRTLRTGRVVTGLHRQQAVREQPDHTDVAQKPGGQERCADAALIRITQSAVAHRPPQRLLQRLQRSGCSDLLERQHVRLGCVDDLGQRRQLGVERGGRGGAVTVTGHEQVLVTFHVITRTDPTTESAWDPRRLRNLETRMEHGKHRRAAEAAEVSG